MGLSRFKPSAICANPRHFGRVKNPRWVNPNWLNETQSASAIYQHRAAFAALESLKASEQTVEWPAGSLGEDVAWLRRKLYGQSPADLGDVMEWSLVLGIDVLPVFDDSSKLRIKVS
jgi:hypothetical protein